MKTYHSSELRSMFLKFFKDHGHAVISSASVIPENDPTVLFTTAGMHPLVPYLMGAKHPAGKRLTDVQKCVRTGDIDDVGDFSHLTFFEMLGNWSLGDYFKEQMIPWSWEFLTSPEYLGLPKDRLAFSVFAGDADCPRDEESAQLWRNCGVADDHIFFLPKENNWWGPAGITGPCGPDTEMFIITDKEPCGPNCSPACSCGRYLEIWNDVFMQYNKKADGTFEPLEQKNVDTGMGLERTICVLNGKKSVYETDLFADILKKISELSGKEYGSDEMTTRAFRIIADHMRTATFIMGDDRGVSPSNVDQGYVLRRLIRRAVRYGMGIGMPEGFTGEVAKVIIEQYRDVYPELKRNEAFVLEQLSLEEPVKQAAQCRWPGRVDPLVLRRQMHRALRSRDADLRNSQPFQIPVHGPGTSGEVDQPVAGDVVALRDGVGKQPAERERASLRRERIAHRAVGSAVKPFGSDRNGGRERNPFAYRAVEHGQRYGELEDAQHRQRPVVARDRGAVGCQHGDADRSFAGFQDPVDAALELLPGCFAGREHRCKEQQGDHSFHVGRVCIGCMNEKCGPSEADRIFS